MYLCFSEWLRRLHHNQRVLRKTGITGAVPTRQVLRLMQIHLRHGAKTRTSDGKWLFPVRDTPHQSYLGRQNFHTNRHQRRSPPKKKDRKADDDNPFSGFFQERRGGGGPADVYKFDLIALNRSNGEILWQKTLKKISPHEGTHQDATFASNSPVTDGEYVYAYFGSRGLYCVDMMGNVKWEKDIGDNV